MSENQQQSEPVEQDESSEINPQDLQRKLYFFNDQLQKMAKELPPKFQQKIPNELLLELAESLLDNTVFGIVDNLMDIQHVTEKQLFQRRLQFLNSHNLKMLELTKSGLDEETKQTQKTLLQVSHKKELELFDMNLVSELDKKIYYQQNLLWLGRVPGFTITQDPLEIQFQYQLLDFIIRLSQLTVPR